MYICIYVCMHVYNLISFHLFLGGITTTMFGQGLYVPKDPLWTKQMGTQIMLGALHSRSDNDELLIWKQDLYREKMIIEEKAEDTWMRGGIPMSLV